MPSQDAHTRYSYVQKYLPLITPWIQFKLSPPPPLPVLTARTEFRPEDLTATRVQDAVAPRRVVIFQDPATDQVTPSPVDSPSETLTNNITPSSSLGPDTTKIPKPPGEPGRPGSGRYSIDKVLVDDYNWTGEAVAALTEAVRHEVRTSLNVTVSFRGQSKEKVAEICQKMQEPDKWPQLEKYEDCWPVISIIKLAVKYKAEATPTIKTKKLAGGFKMPQDRIREQLLRHEFEEERVE
ncbi:hypothetical protein CPB84DRAFT_1849795 [Gymnopilus junonius]|uniref:Uncharacterized protein n=1 Tax=Gymnopilus junonius TaxID=109634 RepID=A0A9P5NJW0_GYMJU|nr:hypothetical protein CPB84DRAFT_1849795 [Gymnopilus junonius]